MNEADWEPLLVGDLANDARAVVEDIAAAVLASAPSPLPSFKGDASAALLLAELESDALGARLERALVTTT